MTPMTNPNIAITGIPTTGNSIYGAKTSDLTIDTQTLPPFQLADDLDKALAEMDQWVSTFIGRMQPYCAEVEALAVGRIDSLTAEERPRSGLERRFISSRVRVQEILDNLDNMNQRLRL